MDEGEVLHALVLDDAYKVERVLSEREGLRTELVTLGGAGLFVRKYFAGGLAAPGLWGTLLGVDEPGLPRVETVYRLPDRLAVVLEYVDGESLEGLVTREGPLSLPRAVRLMDGICSAAQALHEHGIIHRDITPKNVIVDGGGCAHLIDLGIARLRSDEAGRDTTLLGTWGFAAPEQFGFAQTDARSDVYSLAGVLAYMLTATWPGERGFDPALGLAAVPGEVVGLIGRARSLEPSARPQSAAELMAELRSCAEGSGTAGQDDREGPAAVPAVELRPKGDRSLAPHSLHVWMELAPTVLALLRAPRSVRKTVALVFAVVLLVVFAAGLLGMPEQVGRQVGIAQESLAAISYLVLMAWWILLPSYELACAVAGVGEYAGLDRGALPMRLLLRVAEELFAGFAIMLALQVLAQAAGLV